MTYRDHDKRLAKQKAYRERHKEEIKERARLYRLRNRERLNAQSAAWRKAHPEEAKRESIRKVRGSLIIQEFIQHTLNGAVWNNGNPIVPVSFSGSLKRSKENAEGI